MKIDFHTHTFPEKLAQSTIAKLSASADIKNYVEGTLADLQASMQDNDISCSVILPVATKPEQEKTVNRVALETNRRTKETGILSFGAIHPDNEDYKEILRYLKSNGVKGIKLHPVFQKTYFNDIRYKRIMDCAAELDLIIVTHAGFDISFPGADFVTPKHILPVIKELHPPKLVLAHMGGWDCWDEVLEMIAGCDVYLDTSFSLTPLRSPKSKATTLVKYDTPNFLSGKYETEAESGGRPNPGQPEPQKTARLQLSIDQFLKIVQKHGAGRILFGSDSPWSDQAESIRMLKNSGLSEDELSLILGKNAAKLLGISS